MSDYVPTVGELLQAYVEASGASMAQESYYAEQVAEFERGLARIKADAREALLSDETVMRMAQAIYESAPNKWSWTWEQIVGGWKNKPYPDYPHLVDDIRRQARAALTAALGEDESNE